MSFLTHTPQQGHSRKAHDLCHVGEAHVCLTLMLGWASSFSLSWSLGRGPSLAPYHHALWLILYLNHLRFLTAAWKYQAPKLPLLTWQTWVSNNSQGSRNSSP